MKTLNIMLANLDGKVIPIGYEGENLYTRVRINCVEVFSEYPNATVSMAVRPPVGDIYPAVVEKSGVMVIWNITDSVLSTSGSGECQLTFTQDEVVLKSVIFGININRSLVATGEAPDPIEDWLEEANEALAEFGKINELSASATTLPAGQQATAEITNVNGHKNIAIGVPKGDKGDKGDDGDPAPAEEVTAAVDAYLEENFSNPSNPPLDRSLSSSSSAAPADMVGNLKSAFDHDIDIIHESIYDKKQGVLPFVSLELMELDIDSGEKVISGTHNVAKLIGIKEHTTTINSVQITVSGTSVTIYGTASDDTYYDFVSGTNNYAGLTTGTLNLPNGILYTLSQKITSGSGNCAIQIRKKTGGNICTAQNNTAQFTMNTSTCGLLYMLLSKNTSYNMTFNICVLPFADTNGSPYREEGSDITVYETSGIYHALGYTWAVGTPDVFILATKLPKKPKFIYSTKELPYSQMTQRLDVFIPASVGYIDYIFGRTVNNAEHGDVWRLVQIDATNEAYEQQFHITQLGETEMAIQIAGRSDFIGGSTHGDELTVDGSLLFVKDGQIIDDITEITTMTEFETLQIFLVSNMYDPADHTTLVGVHGREWIFNKEGLYIGQTVDFKETVTLGNSYMPMVCVLRGNDTASVLQVTDTYADDGNYQQYDVGTGGFTNYPNQLKSDVREINLFGEESGVRVTVKILDEPEGMKGEGVFLYNGINTYNKIYCCLCGYGNGVATQETIESGTKWKVKSQIIVDVGNDDN